MNVTIFKRPIVSRGLLSLWLLMTHFLIAKQAMATPWELSYSGRLTDASGVPIPGPVNLALKFYRTETSAVVIATKGYTNVALVDGVFQISIAFTPSEFHRLFPENSEEVWVEISNGTTGLTYGRQKYNSVPYALKVPVDGTTIGYTIEGKLSVKGLMGVPTAPSISTATLSNASTSLTLDPNSESSVIILDNSIPAFTTNATINTIVGCKEHIVPEGAIITLLLRNCASGRSIQFTDTRADGLSGDNKLLLSGSSDYTICNSGTVENGSNLRLMCSQIMSSPSVLGVPVGPYWVWVEVSRSQNN